MIFHTEITPCQWNGSRLYRGWMDKVVAGERLLHWLGQRHPLEQQAAIHHDVGGTHFVIIQAVASHFGSLLELPTHSVRAMKVEQF